MRLIVALALIGLVAAQSSSPAAVASAEKNIAEHPDNLTLRGTALRLYMSSGGRTGTIDNASRIGRRRHILWLIEHHPEAPDLGTYFGVIDAGGVKADPEGHAAATRLWREQIARPGAPATVLANAAWFFKTPDRAEARALIDRAWQLDPADRQVARIRGMFDVLAWLGALRLDYNDVIAAFDPALRDAKAFAEIDNSDNPGLVASAGQYLVQQFGPAFDAAVGENDSMKLAERWVAKAHRLEPGNADWNTALALVYQLEAGASLDPKWKTELLTKALELASDARRMPLLGLRAEAEFQDGDESSAEADGITLVESPDQFAQFRGHTILGRVALDRGDVIRAKQHLLDSARSLKVEFQPPMALAQGLLDRGERETVIEFLELCRAFWKNDRGFVDHFVPLIRKGGKLDLLASYNPNPQPPPKLPSPEVVPDAQPRWKAVAGAESYVVEWDRNKNGRWESESDESFRVIPTRDTSAKIDGRGPLRWRVFAVDRAGPGNRSAWVEVDPN